MKYHNKRCEYDGMKFDSKAERERWIELRMLENVGAIYDLARQVPFILVRFGKERWSNGKLINDIVYKADFVYFITGTNEKVIEDVKGVRTHEYKLKKKLMKRVYNVEIQEVNV